MELQVTQEPERLLAVRHGTVAMSELRTFYDGAYPAVAAAVAAAGGALTGAALGWYREPPGDTVTLSVGFPVSGLPLGALPGDVEVVALPAGPVLTGVHEGPYDDLGAAWGGLMADPRAQGRGDMWEEYLVDPTTVADPADLRTRLVLPLAD